MNIDSIRTICKKLPGVTEGIKWGDDLCFMVAEKMFCVAMLSGDLQVSVKVPAEEFDELCGMPGIIPAPYAARNKWILVETPNKFSEKQWEHYITQSYGLVASQLTKKKQREIGLKEKS
jgi:predicted DNA-binding protein (MmcQ/YjbR family)